MPFCQSAYIFVSLNPFPFVRIYTHSLCLLMSSFTQVTAKHILPLIHSNLRPCIVFVLNAQVLQYSTQMEFYLFPLKVSIKNCEIEMTWNCSTPECCGQSLIFYFFFSQRNTEEIRSFFYYFKNMSVWNTSSWTGTVEGDDATGESFMDIMKLYSVFLGPVVLVRDCYSRSTIQYTGPPEFVSTQTLCTTSVSAARAREPRLVLWSVYSFLDLIGQTMGALLLSCFIGRLCGTYLCTQNWKT